MRGNRGKVTRLLHCTALTRCRTSVLSSINDRQLVPDIQASMSTLSAPSKQYTPGVEAEASVLALASRITPSPATSQIRDARSTLAETIGTNEVGPGDVETLQALIWEQNALHDIATGHTKAIAQQLDRNARLNQNSDLAQREVCVLAEDFDISSTEVSFV